MRVHVYYVCVVSIKVIEYSWRIADARDNRISVPLPQVMFPYS